VKKITMRQKLSSIVSLLSFITTVGKT